MKVMSNKMSTSIYTQKVSILDKIEGPEKLINRGTFLQPPVMWWQNDVTQLNENNLNKMSMGIKNVQDEFNYTSIGLEEILSDIVKNNAGWRSAECPSGEIFNDYEKNRVIGEYAAAFGHLTTAGKIYTNGQEETRSGFAAFAAGEGTFATSDWQFVIGKWNLLDEADNNQGKNYAFIIGNGTSDTSRSNAFTVDWNGAGVFSDKLTVKGSTNLGTDGRNTHTLNGTVYLKNKVIAESTLTVKDVTTLAALTVTGNATFDKTLTVKDKITSKEDVVIHVNEGSDISLTAVNEALDYSNLSVSADDVQTVPNAIKHVKSSIIGTAELDTENLGSITVPNLSAPTIYGVAQFSLSLVKNLLTAYILDSDGDEDDETLSAIDKLIEISDWIKNDQAGAAKMIEDIESLAATKLDTSVFSEFKTNNYDVLESTINDNKDKWDAASKICESVSEDALQGIIADGERITQNSKQISDLQEQLNGIQNQLSALSDYAALRTQVESISNTLSLLITHGTEDPDGDINTTYYIKY